MSKSVFTRGFLASSLILLLCGGALTQQTASKPRRKVTGLPPYMTDIPQPIPEQIKLSDAPKTARQVKCFRSFTEDSTMIDVVRKCGIPDEHQGSGIFIFLYDMADGSLVAVGTPDLKRLLYISHIAEHGSSSLLRKRQSK